MSTVAWNPADGSGEQDVITDVRNPSVAKPAQRPSLPPPIPPRASGVMRTEAPSTTPVAAPFEAPAMAAPTAADTINGYPSAAPYLAHVPADMTAHQPWFDEQPTAAAPPVDVEITHGTDRVRASAKATDWKTLIPKLIAPTLGLCIVGMFVGGFLAFDGQGGKKKSGPETKVEIKAAAAPVDVKAPAVAVKEEVKAEPKAEIKETKAVEPTTPPNLAPHATKEITTDVKATTPAAPAVKVAFVDVRLDSTPSGATVTLIDRGKSTFLGSTPISTALDPSRQYDLVFSHASKPTQIEHIDPSVTKRLAVVLGKAPAKAAPVEVKKAVEAPKKGSGPSPEKIVEAPKKPVVVAPKLEKTEAPKAVVVEEPKKTEEPKKAVVEAPAGDGVLMVSSKPPCEILVDGVATGLTTPQRAIKLSAGTHKVTLVNTAEKIKKTVTITVSADQPTKVIENFMK
jgi:hypothetical protein